MPRYDLIYYSCIISYMISLVCCLYMISPTLLAEVFGDLFGVSQGHSSDWIMCLFLVGM
ncbi:ATP synthase F0 subunit 8 (mitochondrion) [Lingula anatina]|uniref:ATP synthase F0 subunit 8 n=1 Tax=Lingula anatina TaxID=7574 RepID=A0A2H4H0Y6_LINAN|nr:ATP synthase F0 subunit 8 [Lingula anatina]ARH11237.1 ATP synthase F0 subunit 8 [Lingula anatina]|eukprot:YP_009450466.1 ATP synthase F0 subunit 8 (mitochondrion) [Lingula anatina]